MTDCSLAGTLNNVVLKLRVLISGSSQKKPGI
jgi:hypothetical protein